MLDQKRIVKTGIRVEHKLETHRENIRNIKIRSDTVKSHRVSTVEGYHNLVESANI